MAPRKSTSSGSRSKKLIIPDKTVSEWEGLNTYIKDIKELSDGATPDALNWITGTFKDHIELRRGYALLGTNRVAGTGRISGLGIGMLNNGVQVPIFTYGKKVLYYDVTSNTTKEVSTTDALGTPAANDDVSIMPYQNIAGSYVYLTSPNSSIYKVAVANPASLLNLNIVNYKGYAKIDTNRMFSWGRIGEGGIPDKTDLIIGVVDRQFLSSYTQTTVQSFGTGDGSTKSFTAGVARSVASNNVTNTVFAVEIGGNVVAGVNISAITAAVQAQVTTTGAHGLIVGDYFIITGVVGMTQINGLIGVVTQVIGSTIFVVNINSSAFTAYSSAGAVAKAEHFVDDQNGNMVSNLGGTGTVNYVTGTITVNFHTAPINSTTIYAQYYQEDSSNGGVTDFTQDQATKGKGKTFPQFDGGGNLQVVWPFDQSQYCFHVLKTWYVNLDDDDTASSNLPYRSNFGIPYFRAAYPTPDGILMLDSSHPSQPKIRFMEISPAVAALIAIVPESVSDSLDLSPFGFSNCVCRRFGDFDLVSYQNTVNGVVDTVNTRMLVRNIYSSQWDLVDYAVSCLDEYYGTLVSGDSLSNNLYTLFSGFDDDGSLINNYYKGKQFNLGAAGLKKLNRFVIQGLIQNNQNVDIYFSFDNSNFVKVFTVQGSGTYVNTGNPTTVGSNTAGSQVVGGGSGVGPPVIAYPYEVEFLVGSDSFEYIQPMFQATGLGYVSIDQYTFKDIRWKTKKVSPSRTITN